MILLGMHVGTKRVVGRELGERSAEDSVDFDSRLDNLSRSDLGSQESYVMSADGINSLTIVYRLSQAVIGCDDFNSHTPLGAIVKLTAAN